MNPFIESSLVNFILEIVIFNDEDSIKR